MQNQSTGQSNLQQSASNLQPNSSNLQQSGTPSVSQDVFTVLSQNAPAQGLQVQSAQTDPSAPSQTYLPGASATVWVVPLAFFVAVLLAIVVWARLRRDDVTYVPEEAPAVEQPKPTPAPKKSKTSKKTTRRKRQTKR